MTDPTVEALISGRLSMQLAGFDEASPAMSGLIALPQLLRDSNPETRSAADEFAV